jgi:hypothetical protein
MTPNWSIDTDALSLDFAVVSAGRLRRRGRETATGPSGSFFTLRGLLSGTIYWASPGSNGMRIDCNH